MKTTLSMILMALPLAAAEYTIDSAHSAASFSVRHMMVSNVRGHFSKVTGKVVYDPANVAATKVNAVIDVTTIDTREPKRDGHLKSPDFFDAAKFPTMTFESTKVWKAGNGLKVEGNLTLRGTTKPVVLDVEGPSAEVPTQGGGKMFGATATTKINRKDFGLTWSRALETGGVAVGDEVAITIDLEAARK
jgi:polyisoprenoid-binding protein YceI